MPEMKIGAAATELASVPTAQLLGDNPTKRKSLAVRRVRRSLVRPQSPQLTPLPSGDDHAFGVAVIDALIEIAMGDDELEVRVLESFEGFFET